MKMILALRAMVLLVMILFCKQIPAQYDPKVTVLNGQPGLPVVWSSPLQFVPEHVAEGSDQAIVFYLADGIIGKLNAQTGFVEYEQKAFVQGRYVLSVPKSLYMMRTRPQFVTAGDFTDTTFGNKR